ncbi:MAG: hypothetical protein WCY58_11310 [Mariniphaga sp.]|nr:hypothetical protein [Mariniphaga sp.]
MKKIYIIYYISLFIILISCTKKEVTRLPINNKLTYNNFISIKNYCYSSSFIYDSLLIFIAECDSNLFHVYNKNSLKLITKFGTIGRGPYDFNFPFPFNSNTSSSIKKQDYYFFDLNLPRIISINFEKASNGYSLDECISSKTIDKQLFSSNELNIVNDNVIGQRLNSSDGLFFIYSHQSKGEKWIDYIPKLRFNKKYIGDVYSGTLCSNEKNIIYGSRYFDEILFFDSDGKLIKEYYFSEISKPILSKQYSGVAHEAKLYIVDIYGTSDYCYVLRSGISMIKLKDSLNYPTLVLKFNWNSTLISVMEIETLPQCMCVDEEAKIMYCIVEDSDCSELVKLVKISLTN